MCKPYNISKLDGKPQILTHTRQDLMFCLGYLNRYMENSMTKHMAAIKRNMVSEIDLRTDEQDHDINDAND